MRLLVRLKNSRYMQYISTITASLSIASSATYVSWSSPSLPKLTSENSPIGTTITKEEESWVASSILLGTIVGCLASGLIVEKLGRRNTLLLSAIPFFIPWFVIIFAKSALTLIIARACAGLGSALAATTVPMYIGEIAEKDIRGKLGVTFNVLRLSGTLFVLSVGPFVSYTVLALSCSVFPLVFAISFYGMPESPYFFIKTGKKDAARKNLIRLSDNNADEKQIDNQLKEIENTVEYDMKNKSSLWEFLSKAEYRKSLIIMIGTKTLQQFSGMSAIDAYMQTIIKSSKSSIPPEISSIICGFVQLPAVLIAAVLVDKMGRKPLLILSSLGCAVALASEGIYFYLQDVVHANLDGVSWLPTTALMFYLILNPIGLVTLPYVLVGELFATNIKGIAVSISTLYGATLGFLVVKFFGPISVAWGMYTMFWIYAGSCVLGSAFVFFVLPETKGKTFIEIQKALNKKRVI